MKSLQYSLSSYATMFIVNHGQRDFNNILTSDIHWWRRLIQPPLLIFFFNLLFIVFNVTPPLEISVAYWSLYMWLMKSANQKNKYSCIGFIICISNININCSSCYKIIDFQHFFMLKNKDISWKKYNSSYN